MTFKTAFQSVGWGAHIHTRAQLIHVLQVIRDAGFSAVEVGQAPNYIANLRNHSALQRIAQTKSLEICGYGTGSLYERQRFCSESQGEKPYLTIIDEDEQIQQYSQSCCLAVHPHVATRFGIADAVYRVLDAHPHLKVVPDTAHLHAMGIDLIQFAERYRDRIVAVHLKNYGFSRASPLYQLGRRFCPLGVSTPASDALTAFIQWLREIRFEGWIVAELDSVHYSPEHAAFSCGQWLHANGISQLPRKSHRPESYELPSTERYAIEESRFARKMQKIPDIFVNNPSDLAETRNCHEYLADAAFHFLKSVLNASFVTLWSCNLQRMQMNLLAVGGISPTDATGLVDHLELRKNLSLAAVRAQHPALVFDLTHEHPAKDYGFPDLVFADPSLVDRFSIRYMVSVPMYYSGNHNVVRLLLNVFTKDEPHLDTEQLVALSRVANAMGSAIDSLLDARCNQAAEAVSLLAVDAPNTIDFLSKFIDLARGYIQCEGVTLFVSNTKKEILEVAATTGIEWKTSGPRLYRHGQGVTGTVWNSGRPLISTDVRNEQDYTGGTSFETVTSEESWASLYVPVHIYNPNDRAYALVRCRSKRGIMKHFTYDDVAVIYALCRAAHAAAFSPQFRGHLAEFGQLDDNMVSEDAIDAFSKALTLKPEATQSDRIILSFLSGSRNEHNLYMLSDFVPVISIEYALYFLLLIATLSAQSSELSHWGHVEASRLAAEEIIRDSTRSELLIGGAEVALTRQHFDRLEGKLFLNEPRYREEARRAQRNYVKFLDARVRREIIVEQQGSSFNVSIVVLRDQPEFIDLVQFVNDNSLNDMRTVYVTVGSKTHDFEPSCASLDYDLTREMNSTTFSLRSGESPCGLVAFDLFVAGHHFARIEHTFQV